MTKMHIPLKLSESQNYWGEGVFERKQPNFIMDLAISKTFLKKWDCTLSFNDVFKNFVYKEDFMVNKISSKSNYLSDTHEISLGIKYSFGISLIPNKTSQFEISGSTEIPAA